MNLFKLHENPVIASTLMCDRHVIKMILETAQLLSTAHYVLDGSSPAYKPTHKNHPSAVWVRESINNYMWAYEHLEALCDEYTHRYGKVHKTEGHLDSLSVPPNNLCDEDDTPLRLAMPDYLKELYGSDPVTAYRMYYSIHKRIFKDGKVPTWTNRPIPSWY